MRRVLALILGGGAGSRLMPLTSHRSKPAVPLAGKYRLVDVSVSNCINSEIRYIYILTQYLSASLHRHIKQTYIFDAFGHGFVDILAAEQRAEESTWFQGTADAVRQHWATLDYPQLDTILILPGDALFLMDFRKLADQHFRTDADVTIAVNTVGLDQANQMGILSMDERNHVTDFREKPEGDAIRGMEAPESVLKNFAARRPGPTYLASMGIYMFRRSVLDGWLKRDGYNDFGRQIIPEAIKTQKVYGFIHPGYWEDIGTIRAFYEAHMGLLQDSPTFDFYAHSQHIYTRQRSLPNVMIKGGVVDRALISAGCFIGNSRVNRSVIGVRSTIGDNCEVSDSILMGADFYERNEEAADLPAIGVGDGSVIRRAIIDKNVRIGRNVRLVNEAGKDSAEGPFYSIRDGIIIVPKNAVIPAGTVV